MSLHLIIQVGSTFAVCISWQGVRERKDVGPYGLWTLGELCDFVALSKPKKIVYAILVVQINRQGAGGGGAMTEHWEFQSGSFDFRMVVKQRRSFKIPNVNLLNYVLILESGKFETNVINISGIGNENNRNENGWFERKRFEMLVLVTQQPNDRVSLSKYTRFELKSCWKKNAMTWKCKTQTTAITKQFK